MVAYTRVVLKQLSKNCYEPGFQELWSDSRKEAIVICLCFCANGSTHNFEKGIDIAHSNQILHVGRTQPLTQPLDERPTARLPIGIERQAQILGEGTLA
jgi:hypothetical protein